MPGARRFRDIGKLKDYYVGKYGLSESAWLTQVEDQTTLRERVGVVHEGAAASVACRYARCWRAKTTPRPSMSFDLPDMARISPRFRPRRSQRGPAMSTASS